MLTYKKNSTDITFTWDPVSLAIKYKLLKRIIEIDRDYKQLIFSGAMTYTDNNLIPETIYAPEVSIVSQKEYGIAKAYIIDNIKNKRTIEYYVEAYDKDNNIISSTDKITIEILTNADFYYYLLKPAGSLISKTDKFIKTDDTFIILNSLENGKYVLYAYSEYDGFSSEYGSSRFIIDNSIFVEDLRCDIPNAVKTNNRYRGPHESKKHDSFILSAKNNINKLKERYNYLIKYQQKMFNKSDTNISDILSYIENIEHSIQDIREEIKYDNINN